MQFTNILFLLLSTAALLVAADDGKDKVSCGQDQENKNNEQEAYAKALAWAGGTGNTLEGGKGLRFISSDPATESDTNKKVMWYVCNWNAAGSFYQPSAANVQNAKTQLDSNCPSSVYSTSGLYSYEKQNIGWGRAFNGESVCNS